MEVCVRCSLLRRKYRAQSRRSPRPLCTMWTISSPCSSSTVARRVQIRGRQRRIPTRRIRRETAVREQEKQKKKDERMKWSNSVQFVVSSSSRVCNTLEIITHCVCSCFFLLRYQSSKNRSISYHVQSTYLYQYIVFFPPFIYPTSNWIHFSFLFGNYTNAQLLVKLWVQYNAQTCKNKYNYNYNRNLLACRSAFSIVMVSPATVIESIISIVVITSMMSSMMPIIIIISHLSNSNTD